MNSQIREFTVRALRHTARNTGQTKLARDRYERTADCLAAEPGYGREAMLALQDAARLEKDARCRDAYRFAARVIEVEHGGWSFSNMLANGTEVPAR